MKKIFTLLAGTVIVAAPVLADDSFVAPPYPAAESWVAYVFDRNYERVATQVIIPKSDMPEFASPVELTSIGVQVQPQESVTNPYHARIWIAQIDRDSFTARDASQLVPEDELVLVWEGEFLFEKSTETKDYVFQFNNPFPYDPTKNLVVTVSNNGEDGAPTPWIRGFNTVDADNNRINRMMYAKTWQTPDDFTLYNCTEYKGILYTINYMPCFSFTYQMAAVPDVLDMAAVSMTVPSSPVQAGEEASFRIQLKNEGNVDVEECSVELLSLVEGQEPTVLATKAVEDYFAAGMTGNVNMKYTFDKAGEYNVAARVVYTGDSNADNNMTPSYAVTVEQADVCDFTVTSVTAPEKMTEGQEAPFTVGIKNVGTVAAAYAVQIEDATSFEIFGANNPGTLLEPGESADVNVNATIAAPGTYNLVAQVISAFDENEDNDFSTPFTIEVEKQNGISEVAADFVAGAAAVTVADLNGRVVADSIDNLPSGIYVVTVKSADGKVKSAKFVVK